MLTLLLSLLLGAITAAAVFPFFGTWYAPIPPAVLVAGLAFYLLSRWRLATVQREMMGLMPLLQGRQLEEAEALIESIRRRHARWVFLLEQQLSVQRGMMRYAQGKFDQAEPLLRKGQWNNWQAHLALACIHSRRSEHVQAWEHLEKAASAQRKEVMIYVVWAVLAVRHQERERALKALAKGLASLPGSKTLTDLQSRIANKKKVDVKQLPQAWYQFFPEDLAKQLMVRGRKGGPPELPEGVVPRVQQPFPTAKVSRKGR
jgi:tetratricopeptide (TPR) repeat protein